MARVSEPGAERPSPDATGARAPRKVEYWRRWGSSTWHICVDDPDDNALSYEPDIYSMISLCERHEFQRDKTRYIPYLRDGSPMESRICKLCRRASSTADDGARAPSPAQAATPESEEPR